jgi:hypothetical protein
MQDDPDLQWENNLVLLFCVLSAHCFGHRSGLYFVASDPHDQLGMQVSDAKDGSEAVVGMHVPIDEDTVHTRGPEQRKVPRGISRLVTVACANHHFAVLIFDLQQHIVFIRDGLSYPIETWQFQIDKIITKYNLSPPPSLAENHLVITA